MHKIPTVQKTEAANNRQEEGVLCFACLTFFPLVYLIGKTVIALI